MSLPSLVQVKILKKEYNGDFIGCLDDGNNKRENEIFILLRKQFLKNNHRIKIHDRYIVKLYPQKKNKSPFAFIEGRPVRKIEETTHIILGRIIKHKAHETIIERSDGRFERLPQNEAKNYTHNDVVQLAVEHIKKNKFNTAKIIKKITTLKDAKTLASLSLIERDIPQNFDQNILEETKKNINKPLGRRLDWLNFYFLTIDPFDAKDHDDAIYGTYDDAPDNKGGYCLYVAIADVAHYVPENSYLDQEAYKRSNSIYLANLVIPMLPETLSNDVCSLKAEQKRPVLGVKIRFDQQGERLDFHFYRALIQCRANLSYEKAQNILDTESEIMKEENFGSEKNTRSALLLLEEIYDKISKNRPETLALDLSDRKIFFDTIGNVQKIHNLKRLKTHFMIECFMIEANICAALSLIDKKQPFLYRIHARPSKLQELALNKILKYLAFQPLKSKKSQIRDFNKLLKAAQFSPKKAQIHQLVLRSQSQAEYHCKNLGHFGLNLEHYTHFTSPIRRYSDVITHRALIKSLNLGNGGLSRTSEESLPQIALQISKNERVAQKIERETMQRLIVLYLKEKIGQEFEGRIIYVTKAGLFIELSAYGVGGFITIDKLKHDHYFYHHDAEALIGQKLKKAYQIGDCVTILLEDIFLLKGEVKLTLLSKATNKIRRV